jgi:hypothetical protein
MSTSRSSVGDPVVAPEVPTVDELGEELPPPSMSKKFTPVNMLSSATTMKPPIPRGIMPPPPPDRPRMSSILPRSPALHRICTLRLVAVQ